MSKVFIVRFDVIQFTRYSVVRGNPRNVMNSITADSVCQELFSSFLNFFRSCLNHSVSCGRPRGQLAYISTAILLCQALF